MVYHLSFLVKSETITYLHNRGIKGTYDLQLFLGFVAPDSWAVPKGTPADIKAFYEPYLTQQQDDYPGKHSGCMVMFGMDYGYDFVGNVAFGYIGSHAGFPAGELAIGAGTAQILDDIMKGNRTSSVNYWADYGDSPEDVEAFLIGATLYGICGTSCSKDDIRTVLQVFRDDYVNAMSLSNRATCKPRP
jgi:hypothetical protein